MLIAVLYKLVCGNLTKIEKNATIQPGNYQVQCSEKNPCYCNGNTCLYGGDNCNSGYVLWLGLPIFANNLDVWSFRIDEATNICVNTLGHNPAISYGGERSDSVTIDKLTLVTYISKNSTML